MSDCVVETNESNVIRKTEDRIVDRSFEEMSKFWRISIGVLIKILQYYQYDLTKFILDNIDLSNFNESIYYTTSNFKVVQKVIKHFINKVQVMETHNDTMKQRKNSDLRYLNDLKELLEDVFKMRKNILTPLPSVPDHELETMEDSYENLFYSLVFFSSMFVDPNDAEFTREYLVKFNKLLYNLLVKNIDNHKRYIMPLLNSQVHCQTVFDRWEKTIKCLNNKSFFKTVLNPDQRYEYVLQSLLNPNQLKWTTEINELIETVFLKPVLIGCGSYECTFFMLLLDIRFELQLFIKSNPEIIGNVKKLSRFKWLNILRVYTSCLQVGRYDVFIDLFKQNEIKTMFNRFENVIKLRQFMYHVSIKLNIFAYITNSKLLKDLNDYYVNDIIKALREIQKQQKSILSPFPSFTKLYSDPDYKQLTNDADNEFDKIGLNLLYYMNLIDGTYRKRSFSEWNEKILQEIDKDILEDLDEFIEHCFKSQIDYERTLSKWNEFKYFLNVYKITHNFKDEQLSENYFFKLYNYFLNEETKWNTLCCSKFSYFFPPKKLKIIQYIVLLLNLYINDEVLLKNDLLILLYKKFDDYCRRISYLLIICLKYKIISCYKTLQDKEIADIEKYCNNKLVTLLKSMFENIIKNSEMEEFVFDNDYTENLLELFDGNEKLESILFEIDSIQKNIINIENTDNYNINYNLYLLWKYVISYNPHIDFYSWNKAMFRNIFRHLKLFDLFVRMHVIKSTDDNISKMWNSFKIFLVKFILNEKNAEKDPNNNIFLSLIDKGFSSFNFEEEISQISNFFQFYSRFNISGVFDQLYILILLNASCSLTQILNMDCWINLCNENWKINCYQFGFYNILWSVDNDKIRQFQFLEFCSKLNFDINILETSLYKYDKFRMDIEHFCKYLVECRWYQNDKIFSPLHKYNIPQLLETNLSSIYQICDVFFVHCDQILYMKYYFTLIKIRHLEERTIMEKIQFLLKYVYNRSYEMNVFITNYFRNTIEDSAIFKKNWSIVNGAIESSKSIKDFINQWKILFQLIEDDEWKVYWDGNELDFLDKVCSHNIEVTEEEAAKDFLLLLLNMPLSKIHHFGCIDKWMNSMFLCLKVYRNIIDNVTFGPLHMTEKFPNIRAQYDLIMDQFLSTLESQSKVYEVQEQAENEVDYSNATSSLIVKSGFNQLNYKSKTEIVENLIDIVHSNNEHFIFIIWKLFVSLLPLIDVMLDIFLVISFYFSQEYFYSYLTSAIIIITGIATVSAERILKSEIPWRPTYCIKVLNYNKLRPLLSFTQISLFLRALNETLLRFKINRNQTNSYLDYINYGKPELLNKETQTLKYVEMCFEAIPQTTLQLYIILIKDKASLLQVFSIFCSICSLIATVWGYMSSRDLNIEMRFQTNRKLFLREFCFYGLKIVSTSLLLLTCPWILVIWTVLRVLVNFTVGILSGDDGKSYLYFLKSIHSDLVKNKIFNIITVVEFFVFYLLLWFYLLTNPNYWNNLCCKVLIFVLYPLFFFIWLILLKQDHFKYFFITQKKQVQQDKGTARGIFFHKDRIEIKFR